MKIKVAVFIIVTVISSLSHFYASNEEVRFGERPFIDIYQVPDEGIEQGKIWIEFRREFTEHLDEILFSKETTGEIYFGIPELDELNSYYEVYAVSKLFDSPALKEEFSTKHRKWGFHLWYEFLFKSEPNSEFIDIGYQGIFSVNEGRVSWMMEVSAEDTHQFFRVKGARIISDRGSE